jgi:alpha-beta hydrolase superfamily lysophospholipase
MGTKPKTKPKKSFLTRHWHLKHFLIGLVVIIIVIAGLVTYSSIKSHRHQSKLEPFYSTAGLNPNGPPGQVIRSEPLGVTVQNGTAERILYRSQDAGGKPTFSSGMVFIPNNSNAGSPRPVVAWAHGTVGLGDQCAPSRTADPTNNIQWVSSMLAKGWVVTATDYAGLGTPGDSGYLVGSDEAHDVLNSVRAARDMPAAQAGTNFAVWGHSQGGHSALFTASQAANYAPELHLAGTVAIAPAAELTALLNETSGTAIDWAIGPSVLTSWPVIYPNLNPKTVTTSVGYRTYQKIANQCITAAALGGQVRHHFKQNFFNTDISTVPSWHAAAQDQTAPVLAPSEPLLVAESLTDQVVLPNTTALYEQRACQAGSNLTSLWLTGVNHVQLNSVISPQVITWISNRFAGLPNTSTCGQPLPIAPATEPTL